MYYKLLEDYMNDNSSGKKYSISNWEDRGSYIEFKGTYTWSEGEEGLSFEKETVSLFELIAWVCNKINK